ncbi:hypothetical protein [Marinifilum sp.]|uniref:hypothetical protein n=1 Tax=Marinifilum sp. TaxID=2033137 RepID=UPI003BA85CC0
MRHLSHKRNRFIKVANDYSGLLSYEDGKNQIIASSGVLNSIWNNWNNFWREFWIAYVKGGYDFSQNRIAPIYPNYTDKQACHYLLYLCGKRRRHNVGDSITYNNQEATWGDPNIISSLATGLVRHHSYMNYVLGVLNHYQIPIMHLQKIRNTFIHLNSENVNNLNTISSYYSFSPNQDLIDILDARDIGANVRCFDNLVSNMKGMIINL